MIKDKTTKELFEFIRTIDTNNIPSLKSILGSYEIQKFNIEQVLTLLKNDNNNILLIDTRSKKEFEESAIPYSVNFPVLNNNERHNVGLVYKKYSQTSALWLAMEYANIKTDSLKLFLDENNALNKIIIVNCWRGGGRSSYLSKMIFDLGYKASVLNGGFKSFRKSVNEFYSQNIFPYELIELSGLTGCGKTELLKSVSDKLPVIDLEDSAKHFSSLLGQIPYDITNTKSVKNQAAFENNLYSQIFFNLIVNSPDSSDSTDSPCSTFLIESESKKVGKFDIPKNLYSKMEMSPSIRIVCSIENRIKRIVRDYFGDDLRGIIPMKNIITEKSSFFKQQLSNSIFNEIIRFLDEGRVYEFTEIMINKYYDMKYKDKGKKAIAEISTDDILSAKEELLEIYKNVYYN